MILSSASLLSVPLFCISFASALTHDCTHLRADGTRFDLSKLGGPHAISVINEDRPPSVHNTTWTVDICKPLERYQDVDKADQCQQGTYVCGIVRTFNPIDDPEKKKVLVESVISVAGSFQTTDGKGLEPHYERLKSQGDQDLEGLEVQLNGGTFDKKKQQAVIRFICDKDRTGNEGTAKIKRRDDDDDGDANSKNSLSFVSYGVEEGKKDVDILRLDWRTKYACEDFVEEEGDSKSGWGFFTWLILLLFLGTAAYLIFGSWLNYNRYGARGWDLLPHGDTIRDIPYLLKDWSKKVADTVSGSGTRGGYSAV